MNFSWIPIYTELAAKILTFRNRQAELLGILKDLKTSNVPTIFLHDFATEGKRKPLQEIDPFTFFASFNRGIKEDHRKAHLEAIKARLALTSAVPDDFDGIPLMDNQRSWFFAFEKDRKPGDVESLWKLAVQIAELGTDSSLSVLFERCIDISSVGVPKLTIGMFWLSPHRFLPADSNTRAYGQAEGVAIKPEDFNSYQEWLGRMTEKFGDNYPQISLAAHQFARQDPETHAGVLHEATSPEPTRQYWTLSVGHGGEYWEEFYAKGIAAIGWDELLDLQFYQTKEDIRLKLQELYSDETAQTNNALACWEFAREVTVGDIIFAKQGLSKLLGCGRVEGDYAFDATRSDYKHVRKVKWLAKGEWEVPGDTKMARKALTNVTPWPEFVNLVMGKVGLHLDGAKSSPGPVQSMGVQFSPIAPFTKADALRDLFMSAPYLDTLLARLKRKKALILQGPPGVGKTFIAQRLAFAMMGERNTTRVCMVQFHPSYGYEDFVQGFRPTATGLERRDGVFHRFAQSARQDPNRDWFFIIDEINRGNLAKIFGELLMLLETDKRGPNHAVPLTYSDDGETFFLPANLHVIGTMNTADRSLAMVDYALRRRFSFVSLEPELDSPAFAEWLKARSATEALVNHIRTRVGALNEVIEKERDLGRGFRVGHSFFCPPEGHLPDHAWYREVIEGEIQPLLDEYFDSPDQVQKLVADLLAS